MHLTPTLRLIATAFAVFFATAILWWLAGYQIGKGLMEELGGSGTWRAVFGFREGGGFVRLLLFALLAVLAPAIGEAFQGAKKWLVLVALVVGLAMVEELRGPALVAALLFVLSTAAVAESEGKARWIVAAALALLVAFVEMIDLRFTTGQAALALLLRSAFYVAPLLVGPGLLERFVSPRLRR